MNNNYVDYKMSGSQENEIGQVIRVPDTFAESFTVFGIQADGVWNPIQSVSDQEQAENIKLGFKEELAKKQSLTMHRPQLNIGITLEGGLVQSIITDHLMDAQNIQVCVIEYDVQDVGEDEITTIQMKNGRAEEAYVQSKTIEASEIDLNKLMPCKEIRPVEQYLINYGREPKIFDQAGVIKLASDMTPFKVHGFLEAVEIIKSNEPGLQIHPIGKAL
ncbi:MAG: hypothetical protein U9N57_01090 [Pseudomonadota bacterium]|nr:hypothetical protein [Pseudomonadota bacterium]